MGQFSLCCLHENFTKHFIDQNQLQGKLENIIPGDEDKNPDSVTKEGGKNSP